MARAKEPFTLLKRKRAGGEVWYYRLQDADGNRIERSTGLWVKTTSKRAARVAVLQLYKEGELIPASGGTKTFGEYAEGFFAHDGPFASRRAATDRGAYSASYLDTLAHGLRHVLPHFKNMKMAAIGVRDVEAWQMKMLAATVEEELPTGEIATRKRYAPQTVRDYRAALNVVLREAARLGDIKSNPCRGAFLPSKQSQVKKDSLRPQELAAILAPHRWEGKELARAAAIVAAGTGLRLGEVQGLHGADVKDGYIELSRSFSPHERGSGFKSTKSGRGRIVPIPAKVQEVLDDLKKIWSTGLLFTLSGERPVSSHYIRCAFNDAVQAAGIERIKERAVTFHSLRVSYNTWALARRIAPEKIRASIGHMDEGMTRHYTAFAPEDLKDLSDAAQALLDAKEADE